MNVSLRIGSFSAQFSVARLCFALALLICVLFSAAFALHLGSYPLSAHQIGAALWGSLDGIPRMIVLDNRLPRILVAVGAGTAFGLSGAMFQALLRNPMASPDVIGFSAGASCGALLSLLVTGGVSLVLPGALIGGLLTAIVVLALAWDRGAAGLDPYRLILIGIGASLTLGTMTDLLMSLLDETRATDMVQWLTGTLNARNLWDAALVWGGLVVLTPMVLWLQFPLNRLGMSDDIARGLGLSLPALRLSIVLVGVALVALAVSVAGPLPFVAFVAGPIARGLLRSGGPTLGGAALVGALVTLLADTVARMIPVVQLPAGVFTALIGAPVLMWLLVVHFKKGT